MSDLSEARFTLPRVDCPRPDYWHSDDPDSTEHEVTTLVRAMVTALQPERVLETGSAFGQTSAAIGEALQLNRHGWLVTLEPDAERAEVTRRRCEGLPVTVSETGSMDYVWESAAPIDFLWLDSLIHLRADEVRRFAPSMSPRAVIGMHDTGPHHATRQYLDPLVREGLVTQPLFLPTPRGAAFMRLATGAAV